MPRPTRAPLSRATIVEAALRLVDEQGPEALSTNRVAAELGVKGPSLYNHVSGRADIVEGMLELVIADMDFTAVDAEPWSAACAQLTRAYRDALVAHPHVLPLILDVPTHSPELLAAYERCFAVLRSAGWAEADLLPLVRSLEYLALASALDRTGDTDDTGEVFEFGLAAMVTGLQARLDAQPRTRSKGKP